MAQKQYLLSAEEKLATLIFVHTCFHSSDKCVWGICHSTIRDLKCKTNKKTKANPFFPNFKYFTLMILGNEIDNREHD